MSQLVVVVCSSALLARYCSMLIPPHSGLQWLPQCSTLFGSLFKILVC